MPPAGATSVELTADWSGQRELSADGQYLIGFGGVVLVIVEVSTDMVRASLELQRTHDMARALTVANSELAPHLSFADLGGHGYAVVTARPAVLDVEFVCLPRPLERSADADGGALAYRVAFRVPRWDSRDRPRVIRSSVTGTLPLIP